MEEEDQETRRNTSRRRRSIIISLKDIPPLDPSSIPPTNSSLKARTMMVPDSVPKQRYYQEMSELKLEEDNVKSSFSNIQIDPNSTRSVSTTQENHPVPKPEDDANSLSKDESKKGSAKSVLHELCISKRWKPPVYDCCNVHGPCHMRLFTYKVVVEIRDSSGTTTVLECFGDPKHNKKAAAEHAAEGALWYLDHVKGKTSSTPMK
ncbi:unnamed protein product [Eruca vesicaria subsp. sativa]|uniref:DRBM domain-containing protein n=1 Tax=Eruca vesicaria subsp. sativa TaxID=29727 RepID=A0ABC8K4K1_ERUVS|nr:unnamed protein product [Eruca vesicaria subsp. sativa]